MPDDGGFGHKHLLDKGLRTIASSFISAGTTIASTPTIRPALTGGPTKGTSIMKITHQPASRSSVDPSLIAPHDESFHLDRDGAAYLDFDAQMTAQLQELEARFSQYLTPQAKRENLGRR